MGAGLMVLAMAGPAGAQGNAGAIRGVVSDADFGGAVPLAAVRLLEQQRQVRTGTDGHFLFDRVPAGSYTLVISKSGYQRHVASSVVVVPGELAEVNVSLKGEFAEMDEMVVRDITMKDTSTEIGLLNLRETSISFQDSVSKDLMSKAGAGDAASALKLVTGATVIGGKYASVRGLSDRYVGAAMNGLRVPSSDPRKRAVHLDVFPSGTIDSISVSKTFTPDLPGDYTGGGVNIRTIGIPAEPFLKFSFSRGLNSSQTGKQGYPTYEGGGTGTWGRHGGSRGMPDLLRNMETIPGLLDTDVPSRHDAFLTEATPHTDDRIIKHDQIMRALQPAMGVTFETVPRDHSLGFSMGTVHDLGAGWRWGGTTAFTYGRKFDSREQDEKKFIVSINDPADPIELDYRWFRGEEELKWSLLGAVGLKRGDDHAVTLTALRNRVATDSASLRAERIGNRIFTPDDLDPLRFTSYEEQHALYYVERSIDIWQLYGEHRWDELIDENIGLELSWYGAHNQAEQDEPDLRRFKSSVFLRPDNSLQFTFDPFGSSGVNVEEVTSRAWRNTRDNNSQYGVNFTIPVRYQVPDLNAQLFGLGPSDDVWSYERANVKMGAFWDYTKRQYEQNTFYYWYPPQASPSPGFRDPERLADHDYDRREKKGPTEYQGEPIDPTTQRWPDFFSDDDFGEDDRIGAGQKYQDSLYWHLLPRDYDISYEGEQDFLGGYWMAELPLTRQLKVIGGARLEVSKIRIPDPVSDRIYYAPDKPDEAFIIVNEDVNGIRFIDSVGKEDVIVDLTQSDWLRSFGLVYTLMPGMNLRANYSQTIGRPTFLELAPVITEDFVEDENWVGNPDLVFARIENLDLRWEWFRRPEEGQVWSLSYFYKEIDDPIETISFGASGQSYYQKVNYPSGRLQGTEMEGRIKLDLPPWLPGTCSLGANYTIIHATVDLPVTQSGRREDYDFDAATGGGLQRFFLGRFERRMEGQPEYLINYNLTYEIENWGTTFGVFYNHQGDTLKAGAAIGEDREGNTATPDIYTAARKRLDLSLAQELGRAKLTFRIRNITNPTIKELYRFPGDLEAEPYEAPDPVVHKTYRDGISYSASLSIAW